MDMKAQVEKSHIKSGGFALSGVAIVAFGAWAVLGPFLGTGEAWSWNFNHVMLSMLPGAGAVLGGFMMLSRRPPLASIGGLLALAGGLWLMVGPLTYPLWPGGGLGTGPVPGGSVWLAQWGGFLFVSGAVIALLSSYAVGLVAPLPDEVFAQRAPADGRQPVRPEHTRRRPPARQPAARRERPHAEPDRRRVQDRS